MTFFPVDAQTLAYLKMTGRPDALVKLTEAYYRAQGLFRTDETPDPQYSDVLTLDLDSIEPSLAGPRRPQDRIALSAMRNTFQSGLNQPKTAGGFGVAKKQNNHIEEVDVKGRKVALGHGAVVIASITSCTNTSNPFVMLAAGLLAKNAIVRGLKVPAYVKTSLAPGSRVVTDYLVKAGLMDALSQLGFDVVGYGCATCIGNSGPLDENIVKAIQKGKLATAAVLSGNRNFEGRVSPHTLGNYLASPPLVVAFALAGTVNINLEQDPIGLDHHGQPVYLRDIWPGTAEIETAIKSAISADVFRGRYHDVYDQNPLWAAIESGSEPLYEWQAGSTYLQEPPFFDGMTKQPNSIGDIQAARALAVLGDSTTTDHISPAGSIQPDSPAGMYLQANGVQPGDFNSFGSRRGNDRVMTRGTFGNIRLKNKLVPGVEGGFTRVLPDGKSTSIYEAAQAYAGEKTPLVVIAGKEYGTGSSRDWAAKGTLLLGVRAVLAESYERIHRSNLIGMGVLPLQFPEGQSLQTLGLSGEETFSIANLQDQLQPGSRIEVTAENDSGEQKTFKMLLRMDTEKEVEIFKNGGIMQTILYRQLN
jgi:aconitate hydratase